MFDGLDGFISSLENAETDEQIVSALQSQIAPATTQLPLTLALRRGDLRVEYTSPGGDPKLPIHDSKKNNGCYVILWKGGTSTIASDLEEQAYLKPRLEPFVNALRHLHVPTIVGALRQLKPMLERQLEIANKLHDLMEPIRNDSTRWAARILVANYGATQMMLWPDATLVVKHKSSHAKIRVPASMAIEYDSSPKVRDIDGVYILAPGEKAWAWMITKDIQKDIPDGKLLRTHYEESDSLTHVRLTISRRGAFFGKTVKSNNIKFEDGSVEFP